MSKQKWSQDVTEHSNALDLYINRTWAKLGEDQKKVPEQAKDGLRELFE